MKLLFLFLACVLFLTLSQQRVCAEDLPIGIVLPLHATAGLDSLYTTIAGLRRYASLEGGYQMVWNPNTTYQKNDKSKPLLGLKHSTTLYAENVTALIGAWNSAVSVLVSTFAASVGMPVCSGASTAPSLSVKQTYPSFVRTVAHDNLAGFVQAQLIHEIGWKRIGIIATDDAFGLELGQSVRSNCEKLDIETVSFELLPFKLLELQQSQEIEPKLLRLKQLGVRVIVLTAVIEDARPILEEAHRLGMFGNSEYIWHGSTAWAFRSLYDGWDFAKDINVGTMGISPLLDTSDPAYVEMTTGFKSILQEFGQEVKEPDFWSIQYYDCVKVYAIALNQTIQRLNKIGISPECLKGESTSVPSCQISNSERDKIFDESVTSRYDGVKEFMYLLSKDEKSFGELANSPVTILLQEIYKVEFDGVLGKVKFDSNGDVTSSPYEIINYQSSKNATGHIVYEWKVVGEYLGGESGLTLTGAVHYPGSSITSPNLVITSDTPVDLQSCDFVEDKQFSVFEQYSFAWSHYHSEVSSQVALGALIMFVTLCSVVYIVILNSRLPNEADNKLNRVPQSKSNILVVLTVIVEYIFLLVFCLEAKFSWSDSSLISSIFSAAHFSFVNFAYFLNYIYIILICLWVAYCVIYMSGWVSTFENNQLGDIFLAPSMVYLRFFGTIGIIPAVSSLLKLFNCSYIIPLESPYLFAICDTECFTGSHMGLMITAGVCLTFFLPLTISTAHFWQHVATKGTKGRAILFNRGYILVTQVTYLTLIFCSTFLTLYPYVYSGIAFSVFFARFLYHYLKKGVVNIKWLDNINFVQNIASMTACIIGISTHAADVQLGWPFVVIIFISLGLLIGVIVYDRRRYSPLFEAKDTGSRSKSRVEIGILMKELTTMQRRSTFDLQIQESTSFRNQVSPLATISDGGFIQGFRAEFIARCLNTEIGLCCNTVDRLFLEINVSSKEHYFLGKLNVLSFSLTTEILSLLLLQLIESGQEELSTDPMSSKNIERYEAMREEIIREYEDRLVVILETRGIRFKTSHFQEAKERIGSRSSEMEVDIAENDDLIESASVELETTEAGDKTEFSKKHDCVHSSNFSLEQAFSENLQKHSTATVIGRLEEALCGQNNNSSTTMPPFLLMEEKEVEETEKE